MQITVTFESLEEMKQFTETVKIGKPETAVSQTANSVPAAPAQTVPATPVQNPAPTAGVPVQTGAVPTNPAAGMPTQPTPTAGVSAQPAPVPAAPASPAVPTATATYTADDLARAAMVLMDSGRQQELIGLLSQFGAASLTELKPNQFGAFATALRGMGAQI